MSNGLNWWDIWLEEIPFLHHDGEILDSVEMIDCLYHLVLGGGSHHNAGCIYFCLAVSKIMSCLALTLLGCIIVKICEVSSSYKSCIVNRHGDRYDYTTIYCNSFQQTYALPMIRRLLSSWLFSRSFSTEGKVYMKYICIDTHMYVIVYYMSTYLYNCIYIYIYWSVVWNILYFSIYWEQ